MLSVKRPEGHTSRGLGATLPSPAKLAKDSSPERDYLELRQYWYTYPCLISHQEGLQVLYVFFFEKGSLSPIARVPEGQYYVRNILHHTLLCNCSV